LGAITDKNVKTTGRYVGSRESLQIKTPKQQKDI